jgi:hypothetical protein
VVQLSLTKSSWLLDQALSGNEQHAQVVAGGEWKAINLLLEVPNCKRVSEESDGGRGMEWNFASTTVFTAGCGGGGGGRHPATAVTLRPVPIRQMLFAWLCLAIIKMTWRITIGCSTKQCLGALATPPLGAASPACLLGFKNFRRQVNNARWRSEWPTLTAPTQLQPVPTRCECAILT